MTDDCFDGVYSLGKKSGEFIHFGVGINGSLPRRVFSTMRVNPQYIRVYWYVYQFQPVTSFNPNLLGMTPTGAAAVLSWLADYHIVFRKRSEKQIKYRYPWEYTVNPEYIDTIIQKFGEPIHFDENLMLPAKRQPFTKALALPRCSHGKGWDFTGNKYGIWLEIQPFAKYSKTQECRYVRDYEWADTTRYPLKVPSYYIEGALSQGMVKE